MHTRNSPAPSVFPAPIRRPSNRTHSALIIWVIAAGLAWAMTFAASAQERARDFISPRLNRTQFQQFVQKLGLGADQRQITTMAFADYEASLTEIEKRLDADALAAGRQRVDDSLSGKSRVEAEELKKLRADVYRIYMQAGTEADAAMDMLIGGVEVILTDDQLPKFEAASRWLNREVLLHPRANAASYQEYAGDGVDVLQLVEEATAEGGELAGVDPDALLATLNAYEDQLNDVLLATASAQRDGQVLRKIAAIEKDSDTLKREEAAALGRWKRLYDLNTQTVERIAKAVEAAVSPAAATAFRQRYDRESFAWLYPRKKPDRQIEWIRAQTNIAPDALAKAEAAYAQYIARRDGLSRAAIDMMLKARNEFQTFLYAMMDPASVDERIRADLYSSLLKNTGEQSTLESATSSQLEALLDDQTRSALREAMRRPDRPTRPTASTPR